MKRAVLLILLLIAAACGGNATNTPVPPTKQPEVSQPTPLPERTLEVTAEVTAEPDPNTTPEPQATESAAATDEAAVETETPEVEVAATATEDTRTAFTPAEQCERALPVSEPETTQFQQAAFVLESNVDYRAIFCTEAGPIYVDLLEEYAPGAVNNFIFLAENDYYNNTTFHRVIAGFKVEGGDPTGTGRGGPGYRLGDELLGFLNFNKPGWLAVARTESDTPNTGGSQFFITTAPAEHLTLQYTVFGEVLEGLENTSNLRPRDPDNPSEAGIPGSVLNTVVIVTDPSTVITSYTPPRQMSGAEIVREFEIFRDNLTNVLPPAAKFTYSYSTEPLQQDGVIASAPENVREGFATYLQNHGFQYRVTSTLDNTPCALAEVPVMSMGIVLDTFATREDAKAAAADGFLRDLAIADGMQEVTMLGGSPVFTQNLTACNVEAVKGRAWVWRGAYLVTVETILPATQAESIASTLKAILDIYDIGLANVFQRTLR